MVLFVNQIPGVMRPSTLTDDEHLRRPARCGSPARTVSLQWSLAEGTEKNNETYHWECSAVRNQYEQVLFLSQGNDRRTNRRCMTLQPCRNQYNCAPASTDSVCTRCNWSTLLGMFPSALSLSFALVSFLAVTGRAMIAS